MKHYTKLTQSLFGALLLTSSFASFADAATEKNTHLTDSRVPTQFLPIEKSKVGDSISYTFIDRTTVKLHPYNPRIRVYTRIINYAPALKQSRGDETITYQSMVSQEYANCDKKEWAKGLIQTYQNDFAEGERLNSNDLPKRWEAVSSDREKQSLIVICSLPINH